MNRIIPIILIMSCINTSYGALSPSGSPQDQQIGMIHHKAPVSPNVQPSTKEFFMEPSIGITKEHREKVAQLLNTLLANNFVLYTKLLNYHWNLKSSQFHDLHAFFKSLYEQQFTIADDLAERVQTIGFVALGSLKEFSAHSSLVEQQGSGLTDQQMLKNLLNDYESLIKITREYADKTLEYKDIGTNNFLIDLIEKQEKTSWMIRSSIK